MAGSSNRDLWQVVTGHSALRDHTLIEKEIRDFLPQLQEGVAYYRRPTPEAEKRLRESGRVRGKKLSLVLEISSLLQLDQEQALELLESYLLHCNTLTEFTERVQSEVGRREVVEEVTTYYLNERLHLLRCLKHMLGYWQDPNHPFREVYTQIIEEVTKDEAVLIKSLWRQYQDCVEEDLPLQLSMTMEQRWILQRLTEQVELLETILLCYKDFLHQPTELLKNARLLHDFGFGLRQNSKISLVEGASLLQRHIGHLCSLILVESFDLDFVLTNLDSESLMEDHHLLKSDSHTTVQGLDDLFSEWGDQDCHAPVLLGWALLSFAHKHHPSGGELFRLLGNRALSEGVFQYMRELLASPFFSKDRPVPGVCKSVLHTLLALALTQFSEDSLGDCQDLVSVATLTLTHPPLRLQFWEQGLSAGVGVLLSSALSHFPFLTSPLSSLLLSLAGDEVSAGHVLHFMSSLTYFTEQLPNREIGRQVRLESSGGEGVEPGLVALKPRSFYSNEAQWLGCQSIVMATGLRGDIWCGWGGETLVSWPVVGYSGWDVLALETVRLLQTSQLDVSGEELVRRVTETACLVTQMMKSDWSLGAPLYPITSQYFSILQRLSLLPRPPCTLLASCLSCVAVMATRTTVETWCLLGRTGFLPYLPASHSTSTDDIRQLSVAPGHYGQLLKMAECPEGKYPVSMAMLDLLATTCLPINLVVTREQLASVVYVMREVFTPCHKWKYRLRSDREQLELRLLRLCHDTLKRHRDSPYSLGFVMTTHLLHSLGEHPLLHILTLPVGTLDSLYSAALGTSSISPCVESVRLSLCIVDHLLHTSEGQSSLLEWNLADTYPHIVANIASYIYHHGDTRIPLAATQLLTRLCHATPLSVFASLGSDAIVKRDAFITRLKSHVEEEDLKKAILGLLCEAVTSQPALAELFLCVDRNDKEGQLQYSLKSASCLHPVLAIISSLDEYTALLPPSLRLLRSLWHGRHDAVLHALRKMPGFWSHVTSPLLQPPDLSSSSTDISEVTNHILAASHVMHIVAMEMYYSFQDKLDDGLQKALKDFVSKTGIKNWNKCLLYPAAFDDVTSLRGPLTQLVIGWKTLLMVASSNQPSLFGFPLSGSVSPSPLPPPVPLILEDLLAATESHLSAPSSLSSVTMVEELTLLTMVLIRQWGRSLPVEGSLIGQFSHILPHVTRLDPAQMSPLTLHLYTSLLMLLRSARSKKVAVGNRYLLALIPFLADTLRCRHDNSKGPSHQPNVVAMNLLSEMVVGVSDWLPWLQAFRNESLIPLLVQMMDDRLKLQTEQALIEAMLGLFITMATSRAGAECLLVSGLLQVMSLPLCRCLDNKLNPAPLTSQPPGTSVLKPHPPTGWSHVWQLSLRVAGLICHSLSHLCLPALLDFTGAHQHRMTESLDIMEAIHSLQALETTRSTAFFLQQLFRHRRHVCCSLPAFHNMAAQRTLTLLVAVVTVLSRKATLKHIVKTMHSSGALPSNYGPPVGRGRVHIDESWVTGSLAFTQLQNGLVSTLVSCLAAMQNFSPSLKDIVMATGQLDREEYPVMFHPLLAPPTLDQTTPPSLGALTACLSVGLDLLKKLDPPHKVGTPSKKSPSKSSPSRPRLGAPGDHKYREALCLMEHAIVLCMGQALCLLSGHTPSSHDQQLLRKELANEMGSFCHALLLWFNRRGVPSPSSKATPTAFQDTWSTGKSTLTFAKTRDQIVFRAADRFVKHCL